MACDSEAPAATGSICQDNRPEFGRAGVCRFTSNRPLSRGVEIVSLASGGPTHVFVTRSSSGRDESSKPN
jgi:hypothetical protein